MLYVCAFTCLWDCGIECVCKYFNVFSSLRMCMPMQAYHSRNEMLFEILEAGFFQLGMYPDSTKCAAETNDLF